MLIKFEKEYLNIKSDDIKVVLPYVFINTGPDLTIVLLANIGRKKYQSIFKKIKSLPDLTLPTRPSTNSIGELVLHHVFSLARIQGPEPISVISVNDQPELDDTLKWRYAMNALLILANQTKAKKRDILTFYPFLEENKLGVIYLFKTPLEDARGGAFDSCILTLVDYEKRQFIYDRHLFIEDIYANAAERLKILFQKLYSQEIHKDVVDPEPFDAILEELQRDLMVLDIAPFTSENVKHIMLRSIREIIKMI